MLYEDRWALPIVNYFSGAYHRSARGPLLLSVKKQNRNVKYEGKSTAVTTAATCQGQGELAEAWGRV